VNQGNTLAAIWDANHQLMLQDFHQFSCTAHMLATANN
jgi:hypothetical protein